MNRKGFTLVELIAMIVVISILMVIAIPNIAGILKDNRESKEIEDVNLMISAAKTKMSIKKASYPANEDHCVLLTLGFVDSNRDIVSGANEGVYDRNETFIVVKKVKLSGNTYKYMYYFRLVEYVKGSNYILPLSEYDDFSKHPQPLSSKLPYSDADKIKPGNISTSATEAVLKGLNGNTDLCFLDTVYYQ